MRASQQLLFVAIALPSAAGFRVSPALPATTRAAVSYQRPVFASAKVVVADAESTNSGQPLAPMPSRTLMRTGLTFTLSLLLPALALAATGAATGEHLHLGQKVSLAVFALSIGSVLSRSEGLQS